MSVSTIVVGTDGSAGAAHAIQWTADLAAQLGARVVVVHAFQPLALLGQVPPPVDFAALERQAGEDLAGPWIEPLTSAGVDVEPRLVEGEPVQCLVQAAEQADADLIVVGARGLGAVRQLVLGSTSLKLPHETGRPVTIVPASPSA